MAITERLLAAHYGRPGPVDHHTYVIVSDGDLMEGVAAEAASLAGHLGLGVTSSSTTTTVCRSTGRRSLTFSDEDVPRRFEA